MGRSGERVHLRSHLRHSLPQRKLRSPQRSLLLPNKPRLPCAPSFVVQADQPGSPKLGQTGQRQSAGRNLSPETPSATLKATEPSTETGCNATVRAEPPIKTFTPAPSPMPRSPEAPTYSPASAPAGIPVVGASTAQPRTPPALTPMSIPTVFRAP